MKEKKIKGKEPKKKYTPPTGMKIGLCTVSSIEFCKGFPLFWLVGWLVCLVVLLCIQYFTYPCGAGNDLGADCGRCPGIPRIANLMVRIVRVGIVFCT